MVSRCVELFKNFKNQILNNWIIEEKRREHTRESLNHPVCIGTIL